MTETDHIASVASHAKESPGNGASILLVDDREDNLDALEAILKDLGQNLVRARSGQETLRLLFDRDFAVILLDVRMPDMDGIDTAQLIRKRQRSRHTPIIFITAADSGPDQLARGYSAGAVDFIFKPYMPEVLKAKVLIFLELFKKSQEIRQRELLFRTLVTNVPGAIYQRRAEPPWELVFVSDYIENLCGYPASDFMERKRSYASIVHEDDVDRFSDGLADAVRKKEPYSLEYRIVHPDGRVSWVLDQGQALVETGGSSLLHGGVAFDTTPRKIAEEAVRDAFARLIETQDNERRRVGLDLHDRTSPLLSALLGKLYNVRHQNRKLDTATSVSLEESLKVVEDVSDILRNVSQAWYPQLVERSGLLLGLRGYLDDFTRRSGVRVESRFPPELVRLSPEAEATLFRVVQESLVNVVRFSVSQAVTVAIEVKNSDLVLEIRDTGRELARGMSNGSANEAFGELGFVGMRERLKALGGDFEIRAKGAISTLTAVMPLRRARQGAAVL